MEASSTAEEPEMPVIPFVYMPDEDEDEEEKPVKAEKKPQKAKNGKNGEVVVIKAGNSTVYRYNENINTTVKAAEPNQNIITPSAPVTVVKAPEKKVDFVMPALSEGMKVVHGKFGEGTIIKVLANAKKITVSFAEGEKDFVTDEKSPVNALKNGFLKVKV